MSKKKGRFSKYNESSTYSKADSAVMLYCIEYELPVEVVYMDNTKEVVKIIELSSYAVIIRNEETGIDSVVQKHAIKKINIEGDTQKFIKEYRKDIGSLR
ncbi:MAG: hypothetical protein BHK79_07135 [Halanaerobium sp. MDAL1]|jgi:sRNA-binding regulator protein Hfq|nr:MAG: hypothetical protein BHK79_07135 [Halanaerobium sp. MDAL1]